MRTRRRLPWLSQLWRISLRELKKRMRGAVNCNVVRVSKARSY
jgi:hypothetical protein